MKKTAILAIIGIFALVISSAAVYANDGRIAIGDDDEADHTGDATITEEEAIATAEEHTGGTAVSVELENEDGYLVYGVHIEKDGKNYDVKVDAGTGEVLKVEDD
jgi:uncharacterized membrane protein YkoI